MIRFSVRVMFVMLLTLVSLALAAEQPTSRSGWTAPPGHQPVLPATMPCGGAACTEGVSYAFFTDEADFLAAIDDGFYSEDFASIPVGAAGPSLSFSGNGFGYEVTAFGSGTNELFNDPGLLSLNSAADTMRITFTGDPVFAVGGNLYATDINFAVTGAGIVLTLEDGSTETLASTSAATFAGFVSTSAIVFMDFDAPDVPSNNWPAINELYVGIAGSTAYTVGGTLSGLAAGNSVVLQNNVGDDLTLTDDGSFVFDTAVDDGEAYAVTVLTQPSGFNQVCSVTNGSGTISGEDVTDVEVFCLGNELFEDRFEGAR